MALIGIIRPNNLQYKETDYYKNNFDIEKLADKLEDYIEFKKIELLTDDLMETIGKTLYEGIEGTHKYAIHTGIVLNEHNIMYQICHIYFTNDVYEEIKNKKLKMEYNGICTYLTDMKAPVFGNAVIFKIGTSLNGSKLLSMFESEICDIYRKKFIHKGIKITTNGDISETEYIFNPVDWINSTDIKTYKFVECEILNKIIMLFYDCNNMDNADKLNTYGTSIYGKPLYGDLVIGLRDKEEEMPLHYDISNSVSRYTDLTKDTMNAIIKVFHEKKQDKNLTKEEDEAEKNHYGNFHSILFNRLS